MTREIEKMVPNETRNQHFVAQGVQALNSIPSENGKVSHIRAYEKVDRSTISLVTDGGRPIRTNLSLDDLDGNKPHLAKICKTLSVAAEDYQNWLITMFVLLYPIPGIDDPL